MKIKTKIRLGLIFLLGIIIILAGTGSYYINNLADVSNNIIKDNYLTLVYTKNMVEALDEPDNANSIAKFEDNLSKQEHNITEIGEGQATQELREAFELYKSGRRDDSTKILIRQKLLSIQQINMDGIVVKNNRITATTKRVFAYITMLGTLCFLLSFTFVINFPSMIANPIGELTHGIRAIAQRNYSSRLNFQANDEFGEVAAAFNEMAERLNDYESSSLNKLMSEKKRIETIINNMRDAIIGLDEYQKVLFANGQAIQLLGIAERDIIGKYAPDVALHNDLLRNLLQKTDGDKPLKIFADKKESYFMKDNLDIISDNKKIGEVIVLRNITRFQELDVAKTNFIATISHELKTPISAVKMSLKLLNDKRVGELNEEQKQLISNISDDTDRLLKITTELLDLTQVESGKIQLYKQKVSPRSLIDMAVNATTFAAQQKHVSMEINADPSLPNADADPEKTSWVLINLVSNAIRYSPENDKIVISARPQNNQLVFSVKDFGKGIDKKYQDELFSRYYRVPDELSGTPGTGLGLAICKEFIEAQGGKIWVESEAGKGSEFSFSLNV